MKILIAGWFSRKTKGTTIGDLLSIEILVDWCNDWGIEYDIADNTGTYENSVDWIIQNPSNYSVVVYLTGPMIAGSRFQSELIERFKPHAKIVGLNVSLINNGESIWNPFDTVFIRDSPNEARADLVFLGKPKKTILVGVVMRGKQSEYIGKHVYNNEVKHWFDTLIKEENYAAIYFDTDIGNIGINLYEERDLEILFSKLDLILTTRLHAAVLALKSHVPVIAVDQVENGAKLSRVLKSVSWPYTYIANLNSYEEIKSAARNILSKSNNKTMATTNSISIAQLEDLKESLKICLQNFTKLDNT